MQTAEPGNDELAQETSSPNDFDRLRKLLVGDELAALDAIEARVAQLDRTQHELPARLPGAIEDAQRGAGSESMAHALAKPVTQALGAAVHENRQVIVDVLFPIIGPAIRKAIAEALRTLVGDLNGAIESSFTPRGIRWRVEAWRSGVPYATIVLRHALNYGVDHVFLIERDSGLVLARESAPHLPELDADAIAGMLTAIGEFVRDSVGRDGSGTLDSARVGDRLLWVVQGPRANLACFIHGVPPSSLHAVLEQRLEDVHSRLGERIGVDSNDAMTRASLQPDAIVSDARAMEHESPPVSSPWPMRVILLVVLALIGWLIVRHERLAMRIEDLREKLAAHPGFVLTGLETDHGGVVVHGLIDPDAEPLDALLHEAGANGPPVELDATGYVSSDDAVVVRRARRLLGVPDGVTLTSTHGMLALGGHASPAWVRDAREHGAWIAGVREVLFNVAADDDGVASARQQLTTLMQEISSLRVSFLREVDLAPGAAETFETLVGDVTRAQALARTAGAKLEWIATGTNDDPGSSAINARVRAARARWLADALAARGIDGVGVAGDDDNVGTQLRERGAFLQVRTSDRTQ